MESFWSLSHDFDHASTLYNTIRQFEEQNLDIPSATLKELGYLFVKHGVHTSWGPSLIHRHFLLPPGMRMVHTWHSIDGVEMTVCRAEVREDAELRPASYFLTGNRQYVPYEYDDITTRDSVSSSLPDAFLSALADLLVTNRLSDTLGLSRLPSGTSTVWFEDTWLEALGTIATRSPRDAPSSYAATAWRISSSTDSSITIEEVVECKKPVSGGGHVRPEPQPQDKGQPVDILLASLWPSDFSSEQSGGAAH